jgi:hypothetical protein
MWLPEHGQPHGGYLISYALGIQAKYGVQCVGVALAATLMNTGPNDESEVARRAPLREMLRSYAKTTLVGQPPRVAPTDTGFQRYSHRNNENPTITLML